MVVRNRCPATGNETYRIARAAFDCTYEIRQSPTQP